MVGKKPETIREMPEGERWLGILGFDHLAGQPTGHVRDDGSPILAQDFPELCGDHARPIFVALESMGPDHPNYDKYVRVAQEALRGYFPQAT